jgi:hypothetical protein
MMLELSPSQTWSAEVDRAGIAVRVRSGQVWITRQGDVEDHVIQAPESFHSDWRGKLVVCALTPARLEVYPLVSAAIRADRVAHAAAP